MNNLISAVYLVMQVKTGKLYMLFLYYIVVIYLWMSLSTSCTFCIFYAYSHK